MLWILRNTVTLNEVKGLDVNPQKLAELYLALFKAC